MSHSLEMTSTHHCPTSLWSYNSPESSVQSLTSPVLSEKMPLSTAQSRVFRSRNESGILITSEQKGLLGFNHHSGDGACRADTILHALVQDLVFSALKCGTHILYTESRLSQPLPKKWRNCALPPVQYWIDIGYYYPGLKNTTTWLHQAFLY